MSGPSSQSSPSQRRSSIAVRTASARARDRSRSSIRRITRPPALPRGQPGDQERARMPQVQARRSATAPAARQPASARSWPCPRSRTSDLPAEQQPTMKYKKRSAVKEPSRPEYSVPTRGALQVSENPLRDSTENPASWYFPEANRRRPLRPVSPLHATTAGTPARSGRVAARSGIVPARCSAPGSGMSTTGRRSRPRR